MRIGLFLQNWRIGGLDTFVINLAMHWPFGEDELLLFCNASHPGLAVIRERAGERLGIIPYQMLTAADVSRRYRRLPKPLLFLAKVAFFLFGFPYLVLTTRRMLASKALDRCLIINGGYPAGDACLAATVAWGAMRPDKKPWHNFHNFAVDLRRQRAPVRWRASIIDRLVARHAAGFVTVSKACAASLQLRPRLAGHRVEVIFNGLAHPNCSAESDVRAELGIPSNARLLLMLGTYEPRKGHEFIFRVMQHVVNRVPEAHLLVCGHELPEEIQRLEGIRRQSSAGSCIHLQGYRSDVGNLLSQADVMVIPSQEYESFGYTAAEAMACQVPVVATDVGGLPEVVEDGLTGFVVPHTDERLFAERIVSVLTDAPLSRRLGTNGERRYAKRFRASRMAREYADLVRSSHVVPIEPRT